MQPRFRSTLMTALLAVLLLAGCMTSGPTSTAASARTPAKAPVRINLRFTSMAGMEALLARHTPPGTPLAEAQAFVRDRLEHDEPYNDRVTVYPAPGENLKAKRFDQPLALKAFKVHIGWQRELGMLGFRTDYSAWYFFDADDRLLAVKIEREIDGL